jgi:tight adherence protein B
MKFGGIALSFVGLLSVIYMLMFTDTVFSRWWARYTNWIDKTLRLLFREGSGRRIAAVQAALLGVLLAVELVVIDIPYWYGLAAAIIFLPAAYLAGERKKRLTKLESQVDGFVLALANSLKTVPGLSAALQALVPLLQDPIRQEIERVVKEMRVGSTLEQSLLNMSARVGSRVLDSAMSALIIGIQVGGNLVVVLENTAMSIREMNRLDGVVRTKTAEGKAQLWVLAVFPFAICGAFSSVQPGYFDPLQQSIAGYIVVTIATIFWVSALLVARKVLTVDI